jgi:16S rRNA (cytidine1402-2'-O)-methyltransferase
MLEILGDRPIALCRELTKLHEETMRTTVQGAVDYYRDNEPRGEYVLVVGGTKRQEGPAMTMDEGVARVLALREGGMRMKDAVRQVSADTGLNKNDLYDAALKA